MNKVEQKKERQISIISTIDTLGFASRTHIQTIHDLQSIRNANRVLRDMGQYLYSIRPDAGERIFYLSQAGRDLIGSEKEMKKTMQVEHYLMKNDMYIFLGCPADWTVEKEIEFAAFEDKGGIRMKKDKSIRPDAQCKINQTTHYVEVDNTQQMKENRNKIKTYALLKKAYEETDRKPFQLIFYTSSEVRQTKLLEWTREFNINAKVYTKKDIL